MAQLALTALVGLLLPACGPGSTAPRGPSEFPALTKGTPEALESNLEGLKYRFENTGASDPEVARANLDAYTKAVLATAEPLWEDTSAPPAMRRMAAESALEAWYDRLEIDDSALDNLLSWADRIENEAGEDNELRAKAAYYRFIGVDEAPASQRPEPEKRTELLIESALKLGRAGARLDQGPMILNRMADEALSLGMDDRARELFILLAESEPGPALTARATGIANRLASKGQEITDIEGDTIGGGTADVESLRGKVVLIVFWGTYWQPESMLGLDTIKSLRARHPESLALLGVLYDVSPIKAEQFLKAAEIDWPQIQDGGTSSPTETSPLAKKYGIETSPYYMVLDPQGRLAATGTSLRQVEPTLNELLEATQAADAKGSDEGSPPATRSNDSAPGTEEGSDPDAGSNPPEEPEAPPDSKGDRA